MCDCFIQNITQEENVSVKLITVFKGTSLDLTVLENLDAWNIHVNKPALALSAEAHQIGVEEHYNKLKTYFRDYPEDVEFNFINGNFTLHLLLKKELKIVYFKTGLKKVDFAKYVFQLIDQLYSMQKNNQQMLQDTRKTCVSLEKTRNEYEAKLNELLERKQKEETELYNKFIEILNEKKLQIQHLNDLLIAFRRGRPTINEPARKTIKTNKKSKKQIVEKKIVQSSSNSSESEDSEENYNTDEESKAVQNSHINKNIERSMSPVPSTSKQKFDFLNEDEPDVVLAKRIRQDTSKSIVILSEQPKKIEELKIEKKEVEVKVEESPTVDFDTQDLLNGL